MFCAKTRGDNVSGEIITLLKTGVRCSSMVEHLLMVRWVIGLIPSGQSTDRFLVLASAQRLV